MGIGLTRAQVEAFRRLGPEEQRDLIEAMTPEQQLAFDAEFEMWAQKGQLVPDGEGWRVWLMLAGRGFGKTRAGAEWVHALGKTRGKRIALVAASIDEARSIMVEGASGLLRIAAGDRVKVKWEPSSRRLTWPSGSIAELYSGDSAEGLRGPEHHFAWCDELAKWRQAELAWRNLQLGLRAGPRPRALVTTTPKPMALLNEIKKGAWTITTGGRTAQNVNLPKTFIDMMMATYGNTRIGEQELEGKLVADIEGSLWPRRLIEKCRLTPLTPLALRASRPLPQGERGYYDRVVIGVDPPAGVGDKCDACGIVVVAKAGDEFFVLADESVQGLRPEGWARAVAAAAERWDADRIVAEANNGGEMVRTCLIAAGASVRPKLVHASRGKVARAEPIALRFEAGKAWFTGHFPELEDELAGLGVGGRYEGPGRSPDRADAMVWAMTELAEGRQSMPGVRQL